MKNKTQIISKIVHEILIINNFLVRLLELVFKQLIMYFASIEKEIEQNNIVYLNG